MLCFLDIAFVHLSNAMLIVHNNNSIRQSIFSLNDCTTISMNTFTDVIDIFTYYRVVLFR